MQRYLNAIGAAWGGQTIPPNRRLSFADSTDFSAADPCPDNRLLVAAHVQRAVL